MLSAIGGVSMDYSLRPDGDPHTDRAARRDDFNPASVQGATSPITRLDDRQPVSGAAKQTTRLQHHVEQIEGPSQFSSFEMAVHAFMTSQVRKV